jgi:hypothetical protein
VTTFKLNRAHLRTGKKRLHYLPARPSVQCALDVVPNNSTRGGLLLLTGANPRMLLKASEGRFTNTYGRDERNFKADGGKSNGHRINGSAAMPTHLPRCQQRRRRTLNLLSSVLLWFCSRERKNNIL